MLRPFGMIIFAPAPGFSFVPGFTVAPGAGGNCHVGRLGVVDQIEEGDVFFLLDRIIGVSMLVWLACEARAATKPEAINAAAVSSATAVSFNLPRNMVRRAPSVRAATDGGIAVAAKVGEIKDNEAWVVAASKGAGTAVGPRRLDRWPECQPTVPGLDGPAARAAGLGHVPADWQSFLPDSRTRGRPTCASGLANSTESKLRDTVPANGLALRREWLGGAGSVLHPSSRTSAFPSWHPFHSPSVEPVWPESGGRDAGPRYKASRPACRAGRTLPLRSRTINVAWNASSAS